MWEMLAAIVAIISVILGALTFYIPWRKKQLRREELLVWSNQVIECLQTLSLICSLKPGQLSQQEVKEKINASLFRTSILIEQGRLFFRNWHSEHGQDKAEAYRAIRPKILDQILIAHLIAREWAQIEKNDSQRINYCVLADVCRREFVSLAQKEVGRSKTASKYTALGGQRINIHDLAKSISPEQIANWKNDQLLSVERI